MEGSVREVSKGALATIQCDGWKDISKKHLVVFMFTVNREVNFESFHSKKVGLTISIQGSVVSAQADVFAKNLTKIGKILRIFDELDEIKSRWVLCQS